VPLVQALVMYYLAIGFAPRVEDARMAAILMEISLI